MITWESAKEQIFEMPTGGAAIMRKGPNLLKLARKEQCLALTTQLRNKFKLTPCFYRVFPTGEVEYLHPKDGVYPEKVNAGREGANQNMRRIGENVNPIKVRGRRASALRCARAGGLTQVFWPPAGRAKRAVAAKAPPRRFACCQSHRAPSGPHPPPALGACCHPPTGQVHGAWTRGGLKRGQLVERGRRSRPVTASPPRTHGPRRSCDAALGFGLRHGLGLGARMRRFSSPHPQQHFPLFSRAVCFDR